VTAHRRERQGAILRVIREREISTQSELVSALRESGFEAVQTTVSRDVTELGLVKVRAANGRLVYAPAGAADLDRLRELESAFRRWALTIEASDSLVVVFTPRGFVSFGGVVSRRLAWPPERRHGVVESRIIGPVFADGRHLPRFKLAHDPFPCFGVFLDRILQIARSF
jgi:arginine repressor